MITNLNNLSARSSEPESSQSGRTSFDSEIELETLATQPVETADARELHERSSRDTHRASTVAANPWRWRLGTILKPVPRITKRAARETTKQAARETTKQAARENTKQAAPHDALTAQDSRSKLYQAILLDKISDVERLLKKGVELGGDPNYSNRKGCSPLMMAVRNCRTAVTQLLIEHGANVNFKDKNGSTALTEAARYLLNDGFDFSFRISHGNHWIPTKGVTGGDAEAVLLQLLEHGADAMVTGPSFRLVPLANAAAAGRMRAVRSLLDHGADVNARSGDRVTGLTPLHVAASAGQIEAAQCLVEYGADLKALYFMKTPLQLADAAGRAEVACYLRGALLLRRPRLTVKTVLAYLHKFS